MSGTGRADILRVDAFATPPTAGHLRRDASSGLAFSDADRDVTVDGDGNIFCVLTDTWRVIRVDRATGARTEVAGNYDRPVAAVVSTGRPGTAGAMGASLFVLDGWTVYEIGIDTPVPGPPPATPGPGAPADLRVHGFPSLGTTIEITVENASDAGRMYVVFPSLLGKFPGVPLSSLDPADTRVLPNNPSSLWRTAGILPMSPYEIATKRPLGAPTGPIFLGFRDALDGSGKSVPGAGIALPPDPAILNLDVFLDLAWVAVEPTAQSMIQTVGGTAQIFLSD